ncbi:3'(2'),5'-bisphosphate nucleotidase CysQ [Bacillus carboniphilus]|uniref:3'(2'),5'-bisphosphate nucleotidase CysQ n=1 Tax=Bacillus carboniphilus TaxID=86663 RepID=A0ABY9JRZ7_9BACI|nr:3'(2'),5'-bisphosphate nucleotidase CysQ [Bacillus carboniphilus]WLR41513.1 3'(2'),5'-bisphosphate nucleotidase CysQ [Bacillus carboniphilus]
MEINLLPLVQICLEAGNTIMDIYNQDFDVVEKKDQSPLTMADQKSHEVIMKGLRASFPSIPILSEEGSHFSYEERKEWPAFWLVDPLDGTKEFIKRNGEFTVNIALIHEHYPVVGVIYAPVLKTLYFAKQGVGSFKLKNLAGFNPANEAQLLSKSDQLPLTKERKPVRVVASRSHPSPETDRFIEQLKENHQDIEVINRGSSLKFCAVAEGFAHFYPRFVPTMEWDTAAGQVIVELAGGQMIHAYTSKRFSYNKATLKNEHFLVTNGN